MFLMWIIPLVLIGLVVYGLGNDNPARAFQPVSNHSCPQCNQAVQTIGKAARIAGRPYERKSK